MGGKCTCRQQAQTSHSAASPVAKSDQRPDFQMRDSISKINLFLNENICCDPPLESSCETVLMMGHNITFLWRSMANYSKVISVTPSYLEH